MADFSKYILNGQTLLVKDLEAREAILRIESIISEMQDTLDELQSTVSVVYPQTAESDSEN